MDGRRAARTYATSSGVPWRAYLMSRGLVSSSCKIRLLFTLSPRGSLLKIQPSGRSLAHRGEVAS